MQDPPNQTAKGKQQFLCSVIPSPTAQGKFGNFIEQQMTNGTPPSPNKNPPGTDVDSWDYNQLQQAVLQFQQEGGSVHWNPSYPNPLAAEEPKANLQAPKQALGLAENCGQSQPPTPTPTPKHPKSPNPTPKPIDPKNQLFLDLSENYISSTTKTVIFAVKKIRTAKANIWLDNSELANYFSEKIWRLGLESI